MDIVLSDLIRQAAEKRASDIHLVSGLPIKLRIDGRLESQGSEPLSPRQCSDAAAILAGSRFDELVSVGELDLAATMGGVRVRINLFRQMGQYSAAIRLLSDQIPDLDTLGLPPLVNSFPSYRQGIILVTGQTGSGKSTTLAAIIHRINLQRQAHILTLEDPVEYIHTPQSCVINQREIGQDTISYAAGLRASLREDPDVILIGEMRDSETIETALTAAETGHLVLSTLHTGSAADSIDRIVGVFPAERQGQIRMQLSQTLKAVLSQQLLPSLTGTGRVCACELMVVNDAIRNLIREGKTPQISNAILTSGQEGSVTMDNAIIKLYRDKKISLDEAIASAKDGEYLRRSLKIR